MSDKIHSEQQNTHSYNECISLLSLPLEPLFHTDADLWEVYLQAFNNPSERQHYNCHACRNFISHYGDLVTINANGETKSALWHIHSQLSHPRQDDYKLAIKAMCEVVERANVTGVFYSKDSVLGIPQTGIWSHLSVKNPNIFSSRILSPFQAMAEKKEDYANISRFLPQFSLENLETVVEILQSDALSRSEKVYHHAKWLFDLKSSTSNTKNTKLKKNLIWKAIASAPPGFAHPSTSMLSTLLDDIKASLPFTVIKSRFEEKMHPLKYRRPTASVSSSQIDEAEKLVEKLGVASAFNRRFATLSDIQTIWSQPQEEEKEESQGLFSSLKEKNTSSPPIVQAGKITWIKFRDKVLPLAKKIEINIPSFLGEFIIFTTAVDPDAPLIFQWDNPVSTYNWFGGSSPSQHGLSPGWANIIGVCYRPPFWNGRNPTNFSNSPIFIIEGAKETRFNGLALFPETLKSELHSIRHVVERYSKKGKLQNIDNPHVVGLSLNHSIRVYTNIITEYLIDRFD